MPLAVAFVPDINQVIAFGMHIIYPFLHSFVVFLHDPGVPEITVGDPGYNHSRIAPARFGGATDHDGRTNIVHPA